MLEVFIFSSSYVISYLDGAICEAYSGNISILHKIIKYTKTKQLISNIAFTKTIFYDENKTNSVEIQNTPDLTLNKVSIKDINKRLSFIIPFIDDTGNVTM